MRAVALFNDTMAAPPPVVRNLSDEVFEARVLPNRDPAPAAREVQRRVQSAHGKRKMPARALDIAQRRPHGRPLPVDLAFERDLQRAIERSLVVH